MYDHTCAHPPHFQLLFSLAMPGHFDVKTRSVGEKIWSPSASEGWRCWILWKWYLGDGVAWTWKSAENVQHIPENERNM